MSEPLRATILWSKVTRRTRARCVRRTIGEGIVKIDYTNQLRRKGMDKLEAIKTAGLVRLRPILMTTATTVLGLLPMAVGLGEGAELRTPMALTVIGGLIASTLLTLLVVPAVYVVLDRRV